MADSYRAGDKIVFDKDIELESAMGVKTIMKAGTEGMITSRGNIMIHTGELRGKILPQSMFGFNINGVNIDNITELILNKAKSRFEYFDEYLDDNCMTEGDFTDMLWEVMSDYL